MTITKILIRTVTASSFAILLAQADVAWAKSKKIQIAVLDSPPGHEHSKKIIEILDDASNDVQLFPIYDRNGNLTQAKFLQAIEDAKNSGAQIIQLSWNARYEDGYKTILAKLNEFASTSILVGAAGSGLGFNGTPLKLKETVVGRISKAIIIGELNEKGFLDPRSSYGPELLTALPEVGNNAGSSFTSAQFTKILGQYLVKHPNFGYPDLIQAKVNSMSRFPSVDSLFKK
ncbi:MAG: hypothetical protein KDD25_01885 [Bdellovibrionales bacterium]|nr:hypothetical protein [Bdellovibrionales bacterium]